MQLDNKFFGKFAKFTPTLGNNAPMSNCVSLCGCIQGHLNFHLSSTSIMIDGIDTLDTSEILRNEADKKTIAKFTLRDLLYQDLSPTPHYSSNSANAPQGRLTP
jgi:hypothetical protein